MAKNFKVLEERMSRESRDRVRARVEQYTREMALDELREARRLTQQRLADLLEIKQASVSKMERRADMYVSTLRAMVRAMGGELTISATFPDINDRVEIKLFKGIAKRKHLRQRHGAPTRLAAKSAAH